MFKIEMMSMMLDGDDDEVTHGDDVDHKENTTHTVRALNVRKGHTFSLLDKSMKFGTDDLHAKLFQNVDGSNLRF